MYWWERYNDVYQRELTALEGIGVKFTIDEATMASGRLVLNLNLELMGKEQAGRIIYPTLFPYVRPLLIIDGLGTGLRHYNPIGGNLCLYKRSTSEWNPAMTAADMLSSQLPRWQPASVRGYSDERIPGEDHQAEPLNNYLVSSGSRQFVSFAAPWLIQPGRFAGTINVLARHHISFKDFSPVSDLNLVVLTGDHADGGDSAEVRRAFHDTDYPTIKVPWLCLENPREMLLTQPISILDVIASDKRYASVYKEVDDNLRKRKRGGIIAINFPEESPNGGFTNGWIFLGYPSPGKGSPWFIKTEPCTKSDIFARIPELNPIQNKKVAVIGLGCIGSPSVLSLAKAGTGELRLLDGDLVSPGTVCRWGLGFQAIGKGKVRALTDHILNNYPFTKVNSAFYPERMRRDPRIHLGIDDPTIDQRDILEKMFDGIDLIYDASAEEGINHLLADMARERALPYISVASKPGGWGGRLVRIRPGHTTGCYVCYLHHLGENISRPSYDPAGDKLQVVGCGDPTFLAAGFDVEEIVLAGVRAVVSTLCEGSENGYPSMQYDINHLSLRIDGQLHLPRWEGYALNRHDRCVNCD